MKLTFSIFIFICLVSFVVSCQTEQKTKGKHTYLRFVGDIEPDSLIDAANFKTCNSDSLAFQYFNTGEGFRYKGEKSTLLNKILSTYKPVGNIKNQNGYIRIRFIVNCNGNAGRFRILASDSNYKEKIFDNAVVNQLLAIIKGLEGWEVMIKNGRALDYYLYLIFKIENGRITDILP